MKVWKINFLAFLNYITLAHISKKCISLIEETLTSIDLQLLKKNFNHQDLVFTLSSLLVPRAALQTWMGKF